MRYRWALVGSWARNHVDGGFTICKDVFLLLKIDGGITLLCHNVFFTFLFLVVLLHGDMDQFERNKVINAFKKQEIPILVATDVAGKLMNQKVHQKHIKKEESFLICDCIMLIVLMFVVAFAIGVLCDLFRQFHRSDLFCGFYFIFLSFILLIRVCGELWVVPVLLVR